MTELNDEIVAEYLRNHRNFFCRETDVLDVLNLPHKRAAGTLSFTQYQIKRLQAQVEQMNEQFYSLMSIAGDNDKLYVKLHRLTLTLTRAADKVACLKDLMQELFDVEQARLWVFDSRFPKTDFCQHIPCDAFWDSDLATHFDGLMPFSGCLADKEMARLFEAPNMTSCALLPMGDEEIFGVLALGSRSDRFQSNLDLMFLRQMSEIVSAILAEAYLVEDK